MRHIQGIDRFDEREKLADERGYWVDVRGVAHSRFRPIKCKYNRGYYRFVVKKNKKVIQISVHRLIAFKKFGGEALYRQGIVVRHKDGNKSNNTWDNILIGTYSENQMDIPVHIRMRTALAAAKANKKISDEQVNKFEKRKSKWV